MPSGSLLSLKHSFFESTPLPWFRSRYVRRRASSCLTYAFFFGRVSSMAGRACGLIREWSAAVGASHSQPTVCASHRPRRRHAKNVWQWCWCFLRHAGRMYVAPYDTRSNVARDMIDPRLTPARARVSHACSDSGYRSKEGYTGFHPRSDSSNIRNSVDQNRSSEALMSIHRPQGPERVAYEAHVHSPHKHPAAITGRSVQDRLSMSPSAVSRQLTGSQSRPSHYAYVHGIEGYKGHRPRTPARTSLGSGDESLFHDTPRSSLPGQLRGNQCTPNRWEATRR